MQSEIPAKESRAELIRESIDCAIAFAIFLTAFYAFGFIDQHHYVDYHYFVPLADAFLHGRIDVLEHPSFMNELVPFAGKWFVVYPPMPAVLMMPFVWMWGAHMNQGDVSILFGALNLMIVYFILRGLGLPQWRRILFSLFLGFGTIYWFSAQLGTAWHIAQIMGITFLLLGILETLSGKRPWLMGLFLGCAAMSRLPTLMAFPFFLAFLIHDARIKRDTELPFLEEEAEEPRGTRFGWVSELDWKRLGFSLVQFGVVLALPLVGYLWYNAARFGSPFQTGYNLIPGLLQEHQYRFGFFSVHSIGRNLYAMLLSSPRLVEQFPYAQPCKLGGMSLLLSTPAFLWAIKSRRLDWYSLGCWGSVFMISIPMLLHADPGGLEFGYRYAMDFYPFLLLLMIRGMGKKLTFEQGLAIALSFLVNAWGIWAITTGWWA